MIPRRFVLSITVPSTLLEDEEAFQFFCKGYWEEMLERNGLVPAEESMVRAFPSQDQFPETPLIHMVPVNVIGYAQPAESEYEFEIDPGITTDQLISGLRSIREWYGSVEREWFLQNAYGVSNSPQSAPDHWVSAEGGAGGSVGAGGGAGGSVAGGSYTVVGTTGGISVGGGGGGSAGGNSQFRGRMYDDDYRPTQPTAGDLTTHPVSDHFSDAMTSSPDYDEGDIFL